MIRNRRGTAHLRHCDRIGMGCHSGSAFRQALYAGQHLLQGTAAFSLMLQKHLVGFSGLPLQGLKGLQALLHCLQGCGQP